MLEDARPVSDIKANQDEQVPLLGQVKGQLTLPQGPCHLVTTLFFPAKKEEDVKGVPAVTEQSYQEDR